MFANAISGLNDFQFWERGCSQNVNDTFHLVRIHRMFHFAFTIYNAIPFKRQYYDI